MQNSLVPTQWVNWAKEHPGQFLSLASVLFIGVKLLAVSKFQATTALAIATAAGVGEVAIATLVLGYPLLLVSIGWAAFLQFFYAIRSVTPDDEEPFPRRAWASLAIGLIALALVDVALIGMLVVSSIQPLLAIAAQWAPEPTRGQRMFPRPEEIAPALDAYSIGGLESALRAAEGEKEKARLEEEIAQLRAKSQAREKGQRFWASLGGLTDRIVRSIVGSEAIE